MSDIKEKKHFRKSIQTLELLLGILGILITVLLIWLFIENREHLDTLGTYGYIGAFIISMFGGATVLIPVPSLITVFALGGILNPFLVGLAGGLGEPIGELTGYLAGQGGRIAFTGKHGVLYSRIEQWMNQKGTLTILISAALINPFFDLVGFAAGAMRYPLWKFLSICAVGKIIKCTYVALAGAWGFRVFLRFALSIFAG